MGFGKVDMFTKERRSEIMRRITGKDTQPEIAVRCVLHRMGYRFRLHRKDLPGNPFPTEFLSGNLPIAHLSRANVDGTSARSFLEMDVAAGSSNQNVLPAPGLDSTPNVPPRRSIDFATMARPTPVPECPSVPGMRSKSSKIFWWY